MVTNPPTLLSFKMVAFNFSQIKIEKINPFLYKMIFKNGCCTIVEEVTITLQELVNLLFVGLYTNHIGVQY